MSDGFVSKIFENMNEEEIEFAVDKSMSYQKEQVADYMLDFKGKSPNIKKQKR